MDESSEDEVYEKENKDYLSEDDQETLQEKYFGIVDELSSGLRSTIESSRVQYHEFSIFRYSRLI